MYTLLLSVPLLLVSRSESSSLQIGFVLTAMVGAMIIISPVAGQLVDKFGRRLPTTVGLALLTLGAAPLALAGAQVTIPVLIFGLAFVGLGIGLSTPGLQTSAVESVHQEEAGVASGIYSTSRYLGSIVGSAILAGLVQPTESGANGVGTVFVIVLAAALLATFASFGLRARPAAHRAV
jgi:MFS family permease